MKELKLIRHMQADEGGITYYAPDGTKACRTSLTPEGTIHRGLIIHLIPSLPKEFIKVNIFGDIIHLLTVLLSDMFLVLYALNLNNDVVVAASVFFSIFISFKLYKLIYFICNIRINKTLSKSSRYATAGNMATNAYLKFQKIPTLEEAKMCSKYSTMSNITSIFDNLIIQFALLMVLMYNSTLGILPTILIACLLGIFIYFISGMGMLNFLQSLVTTTPTDDEIMVAIEGIKCYEDMMEHTDVIVVEKCDD